VADDTSTVLWLQTPCGLYCDIRIPTTARPATGSPIPPAVLAQQKSFAGVLTAEGDVTTWHRHLDFRPSSGDGRG
jgi:hypothetical protein